MVAILGFGLEGRSTYAFLTTIQGISPKEVTIFDENKDIDIPEGATSVLGTTCYDALKNHTVIRRSPGITDHILQSKLSNPSDFDELKDALTSQTQYFFDVYDGITIGVTGTKGKSTTASFLTTLLDQGEKSVQLVGNIGIPVLDSVDFSNAPDIVIYELSSYMLESLDTFSVDYGVYTSLSEAHIGSHGGLDPYITAKNKIITHAKVCCMSSQVADSGYLCTDIQAHIASRTTGENTSILEYGARGMATVQGDTTGGVRHFYLDKSLICNDHKFKSLGDHMRYNVSAGLLLLSVNNLDATDFENALAAYTPLPHRLENIGTYQGITWINDSFATTAHAVAACIDALSPALQTLFLGGYDNAANPTPIIQAIQRSNIQNIILFPTTGKRLRALLGKEYSYLETSSITDAVTWAYKMTDAGKTAVLSCGYPSFTMRNNYVHRGENFTQTVISVAGKDV